MKDKVRIQIPLLRLSIFDYKKSRAKIFFTSASIKLSFVAVP